MSYKFTSIDEYIQLSEESVQAVLQELRAVILSVDEALKERIGYNMPTFALKRNICHFAVYKHHIGFYPGPLVMCEFEPVLQEYKRAKGSVQFPLDAPLPYELIKEMVKAGIRHNV